MNSFLTAITYYLPEEVLDNEKLHSQHPAWSVDQIAAKTGIGKRRIAAKDEFSSDMAVKAANILFDTYAIDRKQIDFLLLCTQSPDYFLPTTACIVQDRLQLNKSIGALDFNLGCSGFVYGLGLAKGLVATGQAKNVLLITSETYSKFIHQNDKSNKTLFGDGAAACLISSQPLLDVPSAEIGNFAWATDGSGAEFLIVKNGGLRNRNNTGTDVLDEDGEYAYNNDFLYMDGKAIFNFTAFQVPELLKQVRAKNNSDEEKVDRYVLHQANKFMLETIRKRAKIPEEKFIVEIANCGNTVSSTIPIALAEALKKKSIEKGHKVVLCGFGVGLSMGACQIEFK